jgi:quercetin 2,3-dioxygenase
MRRFGAGRKMTVMSNVESRPDEVTCTSEGGPEGAVEVLPPREVPLGGLRAMRVRRTLPQRERSLIGAWCFLDHYGPDLVADTGGMSVAPHPHTGLQTVSWLFTGEVEHRDSAGHRALVRPGELNLMTAGRGISHSEVSTPATRTLHGVQLWVALPEASRDADPGLAHHVPEPVRGDGWEARVFLGELLGERSPVPTHTPLLGAELVLEGGTRLRLDVDASYEHGVLVDTGAVALRAAGSGPPVAEPAEVKEHELGYIAPGATTIEVETGAAPARLVLLGGEPLGEQIVMWWNFVGRTHEEVVAYRDEWQRQLTRGGGPVVTDSQDVADGRFGVVVGDHLPPIPAPPLPQVRLRSRG